MLGEKFSYNPDSVEPVLVPEAQAEKTEARLVSLPEAHQADRQDRRERLADRMLAKRYARAEDMYKIEEYLRNVDHVLTEKDFEYIKTQLSPEGLDERFLKKSWESIVRFEAKRQSAHDVYTDFLLNRSEDAEAGPSGNGKDFFRLAFGDEPQGTIKLFEGDGFLTAYFEDPRDYQYMRNAIEGGEASLSGGIFYDDLRFTRGEDIKKCSVIMIPESTGKSGLTMEGHEFQHFAHHVLFDGFEGIEIEKPQEAKDSEVDAKYETRLKYNRRFLKDEILAGIREGRRDLFEAFSSTLYDGLYEFPELDPDDDVQSALIKKGELELRLLLSDVQTGFEKISSYLSSDKDRALFIYQLVDLPLDRFPKYLKEIIRIYEFPHKESMKDPLDQRFYQQYEHMVAPAGYADAWNDLETEYDNYTVAVERLHKELFENPRLAEDDPEKYARLTGAVERFHVSVEKSKPGIVRENGSYIPLLTKTQTIGARRDVGFAGMIQDKLSSFEQGIVDAAGEILQDDIDSAWIDLSRGNDESSAFARVSQVIENLFSKYGNQSSWLHGQQVGYPRIDKGRGIVEVPLFYKAAKGMGREYQKLESRLTLFVTDKARNTLAQAA